MEESPLITTKITYKLVNDESFETEIQIFDYSNVSLAIQSSEHFGKAFKERLKDIGAKYNPSLTKLPHKGWIISRGKYPALQDLVNKIFSGEIKGQVPTEYKKKTESSTDGPMGPLPLIPPVVSTIKQLFEKLNVTSDSEKNVFYEGANKYVWGSIEKVDSMVKDMNLNPYIVFTAMSQKIVVSK